MAFGPVSRLHLIELADPRPINQQPSLRSQPAPSAPATWRTSKGWWKSGVMENTTVARVPDRD